MDKSYKSDIIQLIKQMETDIGNNTLYGLFNSSDSADGKKNVGCNQFRGIASDCRAAECYEEIMLFIRYTQSKADRDASWKTKCANGACHRLYGKGKSTLRRKRRVGRGARNNKNVLWISVLAEPYMGRSMRTSAGSGIQ